MHSAPFQFLCTVYCGLGVCNLCYLNNPLHNYNFSGCCSGQKDLVSVQLYYPVLLSLDRVFVWWMSCGSIISLGLKVVSAGNVHNPVSISKFHSLSSCPSSCCGSSCCVS